MAKNLYLGVDGTARRVRKMYFGAPTECPVYENQNVDTNITASNIKNFFSVTNGSYYFSGSGSVFTSNNQGVDGTTAKTVLTAKQDMDVSFKYSYSSEANYDKFTLVFAGTTVENGASGYTTSKSYSGTLSAGQTVSFTYAKDSSTGDYDDTCTFSDMVVTTVKKTQVGTETRDAARRIKRAYLGVNGLARLFYIYTMEPKGWDSLSVTLAQGNVADAIGAAVGNYALFAGGRGSGSFSEVSGVTAIDTSLTKSSPSSLNEKRGAGAGAGVGNYALIAGGYRGVLGGYKHLATVDVYDTALTHTTATSLSNGKERLAGAETEEYAFFGGGEATGNSSKYYSDAAAYDKSLTQHSLTALTAARSRLAAAAVGKYVLFGGGKNGSSYSSVVDVYDSSLTQLTPLSLPAAVCDLAAKGVDGYAIFAGGYDGSSYHDEIVLFDASLTIKTGQKLYHAAGGLACGAVGNNAVFAYGYDGSYRNEVTVIDSSGTVVAEGEMGTAKRYVAAAAVGSCVLFAGGYSGSYSREIARVIFEP